MNLLPEVPHRQSVAQTGGRLHIVFLISIFLKRRQCSGIEFEFTEVRFVFRIRIGILY